MSYILLVEDEDAIRETFKMLLEQECFSVKAAKTCDEARFYMIEAKPSLMIVDYWIGTDCADDILKIAKEDFNDPVPVVLYSARNEIGEIAHKNGIDHVVKKPFLIEDMMLTIASAMPATSLYGCNHDVNKFFNSYQSIRNRRCP